MAFLNTSRIAGAALVAGLSLLVSACFITPGKFVSELILTDPDRFTFTYDGEIHFLALSNLAQMSAKAEEFAQVACFDEDTYEERECKAAEIAEQRAAWEEGAEMRAAQAASQAEQMSAIMGGIDPSDPEAAAEVATLLLRQEGWERVVDKGNGVFDVRYSITGELSHDFMFPVLEGFPMTNPFVQIILRDGDVVRVNAPGFAAQNEAGPMGGLLGGMAGMAGMAEMGASNENGDNGPQLPDMPVKEGTFTIVTNGVVRANNTDEGAAPTARGAELVWNVSSRTQTAPTALIDLSR
ncbi:hypothetical protein [Qipengyuania sp. ASV99]|uniref:hypothetical protein n=1 Tax=Qipengyuania sp. ASV99 TaxID=3399681 RepID=UPI003A4C7089